MATIESRSVSTTSTTSSFVIETIAVEIAEIICQQLNLTELKMASFSVSDRAAGATGSEEIVASNSRVSPAMKKGLCQVMDSRTHGTSVCLDLCHEFLHNNHDVWARLNDALLDLSGDKIALVRAHC